MAPTPRTPRSTTSSRGRGRQRLASSTVRRPRDGSITAATEPPLKKRRYFPGGPGGGGRFLDRNDDVPHTVGPSSGRSRARQNLQNNTASPSVYPRRERSTRTRISTRADADDEMQISSAAAVAAAVVQSEGYKPREERGWEEFHPNLDIDAAFPMFHAEDVDGTAKSIPGTPSLSMSNTNEANDVGSTFKEQTGASASQTNTPVAQANSSTVTGLGITPGTPSRVRRTGRAPRDSLYATRSELGTAPKVPTVLPIHNQTPKERLDLKQPQYRKTNRIALFESKGFGQARYVDKAMMNVGYQESDNYIRPERRLIKATDGNAEDEAEHAAAIKAEGDLSQQPTNILGRVEYDMDEQDDMWLEAYNTQRKSQNVHPVTREVFEITITKIEKEWHALEKRIPKPNPKPPQTHRPRSSSAAAVNGEPQTGEEQDSKCAICDDGDCENTNAIVFCDGCDLAVHQECYGVPFIPEGQWLCRKCQLIGRGIPTCIFCPNSDGAFKQTNSSKWAHLLCAMWIPEVTLGNHTFMEPVMDVEKVPKGRWKLTCYICNQQMGACIQCGNKACYQAFHVTCARRARLFLRMKNSSGALDVLDGSTNLKALCDKHCPSEYAKENDVVQATKRAKKFYKKTMRDRMWANNQASAMALAATHRHALTERPPDESQMTGAKLSAVLGDKKGQAGKSVWKLPSGAPVIPQAVFETVEASLQRFTFLKRKEFISDACRYWTLKREMRRGAALLKRLQLQMESFNSMELTRRNFAAMGPPGKPRLNRRIEFGHTLVRDIQRLMAMSNELVERERNKLEAAEMEQDFVDTCYFPIHKYLPAVLEKAIALDKNVFQGRLIQLQRRIEQRFYTTTLPLARDLSDVINEGIYIELASTPDAQLRDAELAPPKSDFSEVRDRKRLGKRILKAVQPQLEKALHLEADISHVSFDILKQELERILEAGSEPRKRGPVTATADQSQDVIMVDSTVPEITVGGGGQTTSTVETEDAPADTIMADNEEPGLSSANIEVRVPNGDMAANVDDVSRGDAMDGVEQRDAQKPHEAANKSIAPLDTPPASTGFETTSARPPQPGPPTPPQSNGSLGRQPSDVLTEGGIPWYLRDFEPEGTSAVQEQWPGRDAVRSLSEELTEIDEDELKGLGVEINDNSITATVAKTEGVNTTQEVDNNTATATPVKKTTKSKRRRTTTYTRRR